MISKITKVNITSKYWIIIKLKDSIDIDEFKTAKEMDTAIEDIVVSFGEEGKSSLIIAQSMGYDELMREIKRGDSNE